MPALPTHKTFKVSTYDYCQSSFATIPLLLYHCAILPLSLRSYSVSSNTYELDSMDIHLILTLTSILTLIETTGNLQTIVSEIRISLISKKMIQKINNNYLCKSSQQGVQYIMQLLCLDRLFDNRLYILANLSSVKEIHSDQHLDAFSSHSLDYQKHLSQYSLLGTMSYLTELEIILKILEDLERYWNYNEQNNCNFISEQN